VLIFDRSLVGLAGLVISLAVFLTVRRAVREPPTVATRAVVLFGVPSALALCAGIVLQHFTLGVFFYVMASSSGLLALDLLKVGAGRDVGPARQRRSRTDSEHE